MLKFLIALIICSLIGSCYFTNRNCRNIALEHKLNEVIKKEDSFTRIKFDTINSIEWQELLIIKPYSTISEIENKRKVTLKCVGESIQHHDNILTFCFLKEKECIFYIELLRNFELEDKETVLYKKENANVKIHR